MDQIQGQTGPVRSSQTSSRASPYPLTPSAHFHASQGQLPLTGAPARQPHTQSEQSVAQQTTDVLSSLFSTDPQGYNMHVNYEALGAHLRLPAIDRAILPRLARVSTIDHVHRLLVLTLIS